MAERERRETDRARAGHRRLHPLGGGSRLPGRGRDRARQGAAGPGRDQPGGVRPAEAPRARLTGRSPHRVRHGRHEEARDVRLDQHGRLRRGRSAGSSLGSGPLKRPSDRVEVAGRLLVAPLRARRRAAGGGGGRDRQRRLGAAAAGARGRRHAARAVVLADTGDTLPPAADPAAPDATTTNPQDAGGVRAEVSWRGADGGLRRAGRGRGLRVPPSVPPFRCGWTAVATSPTRPPTRRAVNDDARGRGPGRRRRSPAARVEPAHRGCASSWTRPAPAAGGGSGSGSTGSGAPTRTRACLQAVARW